jgi:hypothetical protein
MNELITLESTELKGIEISKAQQIKAVFDPMSTTLLGFEEEFNEIILESESEITEELTKKARRLRIDIGKVRINTEKIRKDQKDEYLRAGKAIDGVANIVKWAVTDKEEKLEAIEKHFENMEKLRIENLQLERAALLAKYTDEVASDLGTMKNDVWEAYITMKEKQYNDRIEAEKKAEDERIRLEQIERLRWKRSDMLRPFYQFFKDENSVKLGELSEEEFDALMCNLADEKEKYEAEQEKIRIENERLKKEAEEKERIRKEEEKKRLEKEAAEQRERDRIERERKAKEEKERKELEEAARKEREAHEAALRKEREERARIEREERVKREAVERELAEKKAAEERAKEEAEAKLQAELSKGDSDKIADLISDLESLKTKYVFKSTKNKKTYSDVSELINKIISFIQHSHLINERQL